MNQKSIMQIEHGILARRFPHAAKQLAKDEWFLAGSFRKPPLVFGGSVGFIALFLIGTGIEFFLRRWIVGGVLVALSGGMLAAGAYYVLFTIRKEYVFLTNRRIVCVPMELWGKKEKKQKEIPLSQIRDARLLRNVAWSKEGVSGQISLKLRDGKSRLLPKLAEAAPMYEELKQVLLDLPGVLERE